MWVTAIKTVRMHTGYPIDSDAINEAQTKCVSVENPSTKPYSMLNEVANQQKAPLEAMMFG